MDGHCAVGRVLYNCDSGAVQECMRCLQTLVHLPGISAAMLECPVSLPGIADTGRPLLTLCIVQRGGLASGRVDKARGHQRAAVTDHKVEE